MNDRVTKSAQIFRVGGTAAILCLGSSYLQPKFRPGRTPAEPITGYASKSTAALRARRQSGSVVAVESPIAGTTTSVNTINPTVSGPGAYSGGARSTAKLPFSGNSLSAKPSSEGSTSILAPGLSYAALQAQRAKSGCTKRLASQSKRQFDRDRATDQISGRQEYASIRQSQALTSHRSWDPSTTSICAPASLNRSLI